MSSVGDGRRVLFYVQHLLGIGHLKRAATLSRALVAAGFEVRLVSGGRPVPGLNISGVEFVQLPPVAAPDGSFSRLVDAHGETIDDAFREARHETLFASVAEFHPHAVVTELFPFGRRQLSFELIPLLEQLHAQQSRPRIVSSVRDILVEPGKPERIDEMLDRIERYYDLVLVHGDPDLIPFDETFPPAHRIAHRLRYTGYVVDRPPGPGGPDAPGAGEVVVSAGGGGMSERLLRAAIEARALTGVADLPWRVLAGWALDDGIFNSLEKSAPDGVIVERARGDFTTLVANCLLSISQGGYNTVMEVLAAGARGVIVPYAGDKETEQTLRAQLLASRGVLQVVPEDGVSPQALAHAVDTALLGPPSSAAGLRVDGGAASARILAELLARSPAVAS